ncbi:hypothetical protein SADUNF_Sadunf02G0074200 [Salix dunnii]|uniref:Uncharacterized protein n=1 Tax=Salix dunnii TaxID=1413687 RepID=A0A835N6L5_9ROSI|nr:hypothetical protein SADUNF_Sadunf02G0074200 [Salix dunnii]
MKEIVKQTSCRVQSAERINSRNQTGVPKSRIFNFCVNLINYLKGIDMWVAMQQGVGARGEGEISTA